MPFMFKDNNFIEVGAHKTAARIAEGWSLTRHTTKTAIPVVPAPLAPDPSPVEDFASAMDDLICFAPEPEPTSENAPLSPDELAALTKAQLLEIAQDLGVPISPTANKAVIIAALVDATTPLED